MQNKRYIWAILLVLSIALAAGCTGTTEKTVAKNDTVTVNYIGWFDNGTIFDTSIESVARDAGIYDQYLTYEPITFMAGAGDVIEGFDDAVIGMKLNESRNVTIEPAKAYGDYDPSLIKPVNMTDLLSNNITPQVNDTLYYGMQPVTVYAIPNNTTVLIDFNYPLAGKTLHYQIMVLNITSASSS